jgi:hypothetical protein
MMPSREERDAWIPVFFGSEKVAGVMTKDGGVVNRSNGGVNSWEMTSGGYDQRRRSDNLQVKEVWVGSGERRRRYVVCYNPQEAERQRAHREELLVELEAELTI